MALPRDVLPGRTLMINRRCLERRFFLRPDAITNQIILYCLAVAAARTGMEIILPSFLSNHHHTILYDRFGRQAEFTEYLHRLIARAVNAHRGRWESLWSNEQVSVVDLADPVAVMNELVYAATNPVKDKLVARVADWPGVNGLDALLEDRPITVRRPDVFFRRDGDMPEEATLTLSIPPELGDAAAIRRELRRRVAAVEVETARELAREGQKVLGRKRILAQHWDEHPSSSAPRRGLRPRFAGSRWARIEAALRRRAFVDAYRAARALWCRGLAAVFPVGTYWLRRFANVTVEGDASPVSTSPAPA